MLDISRALTADNVATRGLIVSGRWEAKTGGGEGGCGGVWGASCGLAGGRPVSPYIKQGMFRASRDCQKLRELWG